MLHFLHPLSIHDIGTVSIILEFNQIFDFNQHTFFVADVRVQLSEINFGLYTSRLLIRK